MVKSTGKFEWNVDFARFLACSRSKNCAESDDGLEWNDE